MIAKDYTKQEQVVAQVISDLGLRYEQQYTVGPYTVDFYLPELQIVIEADGVYGHFRRSDAKRDAALNKYGFAVIHIGEHSKAKIKQILCDLLCLE